MIGHMGWFQCAQNVWPAPPQLKFQERPRGTPQPLWRSHKSRCCLLVRPCCTERQRWRSNRRLLPHPPWRRRSLLAMARQPAQGLSRAPKRARRQTASPESSPESARLPLLLHALFRVVVSNDLLVRVIIFPDNFHVESRLLKFFHRVFRCCVVVIHCDCCVCARLFCLPFKFGFGWPRFPFTLPLRLSSEGVSDQ
jgi:hypothetical protein